MMVEKRKRRAEMKFFSMLPALGRRWLEPVDPDTEDEDWRCDPLAHPALEAMSPRELADLPFDRSYRLPQETPTGRFH
jgi:hypothetical protein